MQVFHEERGWPGRMVSALLMTAPGGNSSAYPRSGAARKARTMGASRSAAL
jgi:hypothetical protein